MECSLFFYFVHRLATACYLVCWISDRLRLLRFLTLDLLFEISFSHWIFAFGIEFCLWRFVIELPQNFWIQMIDSIKVYRIHNRNNRRWFPPTHNVDKSLLTFLVRLKYRNTFYDGFTNLFRNFRSIVVFSISINDTNTWFSIYSLKRNKALYLKNTDYLIPILYYIKK